MKWQEYQEAVGEFYTQIDSIGKVFKNITLPDRITGHARQIDVWIEIEAKSHKIGILIDAKYRKEKIDVKDVEEVASLADAVGAKHAVLVALKGWTEPAGIKAQAIGLDLRLLTLEQALDLMVPDKWIICPQCETDCIIANHYGMIVDNMWSLLTAGRCRECQTARIDCRACGDKMIINLNENIRCDCGHSWKNFPKSIKVRISGNKTWSEISSNVGSLDSESANIHIRNGIEYRENGNIIQAIEEFSKAIEKMPIAAIPYYHRAITYNQYGYLEEAIEDYTIAIALHPEYPMSYASRGLAYYTSGYLQEAISDLKHYLILEPNSSDRIVIENVIRVASRDLEDTSN